MATVISRYLFELPIMWSEELMRLTLLASTFYGCVIAYRKDTHVRIGDFLIKFFPKWEQAIKILEETLNIFFLLILLVTGTQVCLVSWGTKTLSLGISVVIFFCIVPISSALMIIISSRRIQGMLYNMLHKKGR